MGLARRDKVGRAAGIAIVLAVVLLAAPAAQAARSEFYGITQPQALSGLDIFQMAGAKVHTDRFPLQWSLVEPHKNTFRWSKYDRLIGSLAVVGTRSAPFVWGSPRWAGTGGTSRPPASAAARTAWQTFLRAAVTRYGPGGTYWSNGYKQRFGSGATPLPITSWQIWNEVNLKFSYPGTTYQQKAQKYGQLVKISHSAIRGKDRNAKVVLAGITTQKDPNAFNFLNSLYGVPHIKDNFEAVAQHPYASTNTKIKTAIKHVRSVMANHGDKATPLWITEFAWGSGPPDSIGINKGLNGQKQALTASYNMLLANRKAWNLQRVYWFLWRDPPAGSDFADGCSFCGTAGLYRNNGNAKPALSAFKSFTNNPPP
jgi:hypothetical protein